MGQSRYIHRLRIRIPIPAELTQRQRQTQELSGSIDSNSIETKPKYSDDEVYEAISKLTKIPNTFKLNNTVCERKNDVDLLQQIQNPDNAFDYRVNNLCDYLNKEDESTKYLPSRFIKEKHLIPYEELCKINHDVHTRLSVTKILPKAYCELRDMYQLYMGGLNIETKAMASGKKIHRVIEEKIHPQVDICLKQTCGDEIVQIDEQKDLVCVKSIKNSLIEETVTKTDTTSIEESMAETTKEYLEDQTEDKTEDETEDQTEDKTEDETEDQTEDLTEKPKHVLIFIDLTHRKFAVSLQIRKISQTIMRIINIFKFSVSREILVHVLFNKKTGQIMTEVPVGGFNDEEHIIISGVVDDLHLSSEHEDAFQIFQKELKEEINKSFDFDDTFKAIKSKMDEWTGLDDPMLYLVVNDDKSRASRYLPSREYQKTQLLQVGMYRLFLDILSRDVNFAYESWRYNMISRGESLDEPLDNSTVSFTYCMNHYLLNDFIKLKNGEPLDFEGIKSPPRSDEPYVFENKTNDSTLDVLVGAWKTAPTFAHILARLAQVEHLLGKFLSNKIEVTYVDRSSGNKLNVIHDEYDKGYVEEQVHLGMDLWMGKREPYPTNNERACKSCDFRIKCKIPNLRKGLL